MGSSPYCSPPTIGTYSQMGRVLFPPGSCRVNRLPRPKRGRLAFLLRGVSTPRLAVFFARALEQANGFFMRASAPSGGSCVSPSGPARVHPPRVAAPPPPPPPARGGLPTCGCVAPPSFFFGVLLLLLCQLRLDVVRLLWCSHCFSPCNIQPPPFLTPCFPIGVPIPHANTNYPPCLGPTRWQRRTRPPATTLAS